MTTFNMNFGPSGTSLTQNVTANNDTINVSADGFKGGTSWSTSTTNCSVSPSSGTIPSGQGNVSLTVSSFPRSTSNGSYSFTITGNNGNRTCTGSGTIGASTGTISITVGYYPFFPAGGTATVNWTSNDSSAKGWNSTTGRFSPGTGSNTLTGTSGSFTLTCQDPDGDPTGAPDGVWESNQVSLRLSDYGSSTIDTSNSIYIFTQADAGTASVSLTTDTQANGTFTITGSTTATSPGTVNYRFIDGPNTSGTVLQAFSSSNTYNGTGSQRGSPITLQVRERIQTNNTGFVYSEDFSSATITVPYVNAQTNVTLPTNKNILWDASSFSLTIGNGNILDEYKVVLTSNTSVVLEDWTTKNTASGSDFTFTVSNNINTTYFPSQDLADPGVSCTVYVRRSTTNGGDGSVTSVGTFTVKRRYREGPFASISGPSAATIGAQEYFYYNGTSRAVTIGGAGIVNGFTYIARIDSGTTYGGATSGIVINSVASGGSASGSLTQNQLPPVNASVTYRVYCIVPTSLGGDGTTEWACSPLQIYTPTNSAQTRFTVTRSDYVAADTTTSAMSVSGTGVVDVFAATGSGQNQYAIANSNTTTNPSISITSVETNQRYRLNNGSSPGSGSEVVYDNFGTGNTSLSATVSNSNITTSFLSYFLWTQVPEVEDGTGAWSVCYDPSAVLTFAQFYREAAFTTPGITRLQARIDGNDHTKIVPFVQLTDTAGGGTNNGDIQFAWSTSSSSPTNWYTHSNSDGTNVAGYWSANFNLAKSNTPIYVGIRKRSPLTGGVGTAVYGSTTITGSTFVVTPGGGTSEGYLNQTNGWTSADYIINNNEIRLYASSSLNETVTFDALSNPTEDTIVQNDHSNTSAFFTNKELQSQYGIDITSGTTAGNLTVGDTVASQTLATGNTSNTSLTFGLTNPGDLPALGNTVNYKFWRRQTSANGGDGTKYYPNQAGSVAEFFARRVAQADGTITVTGVRQTLANNHSTNLVLTIADGNSSTQYRLYSQGATYDTRVGNGTVTATNPGELPTAGNTRNYNIQYRQASTSDTYQNATGTGTSFTLGRLAAMNLGTLSNPVSIESSVNSAVITLDGAVGNITALLTKNSGGGTVRLSKNGQTYANSTASGTSITVVDGDTLAVRAESPSTYSNTTTCTLTLTQDSVTIFSDTFSFTTEADPGGNTGTGGGTGNYGLELRDASNNVIITNSDRVGDFCYATTVTVASGASSGVSTTQSVGGNVVIIEENLNPNNEDDRVYATLENNGKEVRINMLGVTASTTLTFNVLVFNI